MALIRYFIPGDGDEEAHPNVFRLPARVEAVTLEQVKKTFPLPGEYHFRVKKMVDGRACWVDLHGEAIPLADARVILKVARISMRGGPAPAAAPVATSPPHQQAQPRPQQAQPTPPQQPQQPPRQHQRPATAQPQPQPQPQQAAPAPQQRASSVRRPSTQNPLTAQGPASAPKPAPAAAAGQQKEMDLLAGFDGPAAPAAAASPAAAAPPMNDLIGLDMGTSSPSPPNPMGGSTGRPSQPMMGGTSQPFMSMGAASPQATQPPMGAQSRGSMPGVYQFPVGGGGMGGTPQMGMGSNDPFDAFNNVGSGRGQNMHRNRRQSNF